MKIAGEISLCVCARQGDQGPSHISRIQMVQNMMNKASDSNIDKEENDDNKII